MKTMHLYLTVALEVGFLALSSAAPLSQPEETVTGHAEETQKAYNMKITERLVNGTGDRRPQCGVVDPKKFKILPGEKTFAQKDLTYRVNQYTSDLSEAIVDDVLKQAFKIWSDVTPLTFTKSESMADIEITFVSGAHGDGAPFDGRSGTLAHAFGPGPGLGGDAHFDEAETWTTDSTGINLFLVAAHEFGHSLGLGHSNDENALMFPFYTFVDTNGYTLPNDDVQGIQSLYGPALATTQAPSQPPTQAPSQLPTQAPSQPPTQAPSQPPTEEPPTCDPNLFADAAFRTGGRIYFFKNGYYTSTRSSEVIPVEATWPSPQSNIDAAYERGRRNLYFFTGSQYWSFRGTVLRSGYPNPISDLGFPNSVNKIDAAMYVGRGRIVFFVGDQLWLSNQRRQMIPGYPRSIRKFFPEVSNNVDAAFAYGRYFYLTSGPFVYVYTRRGLFVKRFNPEGWMDCGQINVL